MPAIPGLIPEVTINGTFGELWLADTSEWLVNVQEVDARLRIDRAEVRMAGNRGMGYKALGVSGEGTVRMYKVTTRFLESISRLFRDGRGRMEVMNMIVKLDDPEALGVERIRLGRVKFWEINFGYNLNNLQEESIPFTFEVFEIMDAITGDPTRPTARP